MDTDLHAGADARVAVAAESAHAGAAVAEEFFRTDLDVERKAGKTDVVTRADRLAQEAVVDRVTETFPEARIVGEEGDAEGRVPDQGTVWLVDPIDGTNNFVRGSRYWATSVACLVDGDPVAAANYLPVTGDRFVASAAGVGRNGETISVSERTDTDLFTVVPTVWWGFDRREEYVAAAEAILTRFGDLRRLGSAQASLSLLAAGVFDGVFTNVDAHPWDTVAGAAMVRWAGGTVTDLSGKEWRHDSRGLVASNGRAHEAVLAAARDTERRADR